MKKDQVIQIRLGSEDRVRWQTAADLDQRTLSDWIRVTLNAHIQPKRKAP